MNTDTTALTTTGQVISGTVDLASDEIIRNPDGSVTYPHAGRYVVTWQARFNVTVATEIYVWVEEWDPVLEQWDVVPYSGVARDFPTTNEVEFAMSYLRVVTDRDTYRVMMSKSAAGTASLISTTLPSGAVMPSFRMDIRG